MRRITSADLPQADRLESVLQTVIEVGNGVQTDSEIANKIPTIQGDDRQGRYYRNAAELLGFIENSRNKSSLTQKGIELLKNPLIANPLFITSILNLVVYQKLFPYLELHPEGCTRMQILNYLQSVANPGIGSSMIPRRISTILAWPRILGFMNKGTNNKFQLNNNFSRDIPVFDILDDDQPLLPITGDLAEYQEIGQRITYAHDEVMYFKDQAKLERATNAHIALVNIVAQKSGIMAASQNQIN